MTYRVFYMKPHYFRDLSCGDIMPTIAGLNTTHVELRQVVAEGLDHVFNIQQAHNWADDWRACNALLESKGLKHTSMSIGDVIQDERTSDYYVVAFAGFTKLA